MHQLLPVTMYIARDGTAWRDCSWEDEPYFQTSQIKDGTDEERPPIWYWVMPDARR